MKSLFATATLVALVSTPALAQANQHEPEGLYLGVGLGQAKLDNETLDWLDDVGASTDDSDTSYKLFVGYQFNPNFALEASYLDFGEFTADASAVTQEYFASANAKLDVGGVGFALVGKLPIQNGFSIYGKLGMIAWDGDVSADFADTNGTQVSDSASEDGSDPFYGLGAEYGIGQIMLRGEYERYEISARGEDFETDMITASIGYRF